MKLILLIAGAGMCGTLCRYFAVKAVDRWLPGFPWGTLCVNVAGAFLAAFVFVWSRSAFPQYERWFPVIFVGFFGAFTTFSTFALESARFLAAGRHGRFFLDLLLQNGCGIAAAVLGLYIADRIFVRG